ncbi:MAG TPA: NAD(P)/FAD-dependent oxidoreductase [candidate division Zixibacteria bacterium]|nr:NAD(P)/FAD-dependent oxidoreductase [candidate division Zixibacteria bacterium]
MNQKDNQHHVVIIGGGFGGMHAAMKLRKAPVRITLLDKRNFHLFQPLLYQVATGGLSPGDIAYPIRSAVGRVPNVTVLAAEVMDISPDQKKIHFADGDLSYDSLIVATGVVNHYFGHDDWSEHAPGLKTVEDALYIRRRILIAFEDAERESDPRIRRAYLNFVVAGGGPTGVELSGAISMLANTTLKGEFRHIDPTESEVYLIEGSDRLLNTFPEGLSAKAEAELKALGVHVRTNHLVTDISSDRVIIRDLELDKEEEIQTRTVLWAAGVRASPLGQMLAEKTGAELDKMGRVIVEDDLTIPGHPEIFILGDMANFIHQDGEPLPGVAQVAMQGGSYAGQLIQKRLEGKSMGPFHYKDKGTMAVIGRNAAVADIGPFQFGGFIAWFLWIFIHIGFLIGFDNKFMVMFQWAWHYITRKRGALLITGPHPYPLVQSKAPAGEDEPDR